MLSKIRIKLACILFSRLGCVSLILLGTTLDYVFILFKEHQRTRSDTYKILKEMITMLEGCRLIFIAMFELAYIAGSQTNTAHNRTI